MKVNNYNSSVTEEVKENSEEVFVFPASFGQKRLWLLEQLQPGNSAYNECGAMNCRGQLNTVALEQSLNEIVRRHEVLRTYFAIVKGEPVQVILPSLTFKLSLTDLRSIAENELEVQVKQLIEQEAQKPFNLKQAPLMRSSLLQLAENEYVLILVLHHIIHDGWSMGLIFREIETLYEAFSNHKPSPLPELSIQYADFTVHQNQWLQGEVLENLLNYWEQKLKNQPVLALPTDRPRTTTETYRGATKILVLPKELCNAIKALSQQQGTTLFMTLLAAFKTLLYRYTQQPDISVGTPIAGRNLAQTENLIGFFVNTLVLRSNLEGNPSFLEVLTEVSQVAMEAYDRQDFPFEKLVEVLNPERYLGQTPLFQVMFVLQNNPLSQIKLSGVTLEPIPREKNISKFDLTLSMEEISPGKTSLLENNYTGSLDKNKYGMIAGFDYNADLFDSETIERMAQHFQILLTGIVANPDSPISELPILTEAERNQLLLEWNDTVVEYPQDKCIHQLFEEQVQKTPDAVAVVFEKQQLTYQQLNAKANQLAHYLQSLGVQPDTLVGICINRSLEMIVGLLGILKAGGAYVPIDPSYPTERLAYMLEDAALPVLLTSESVLPSLPEHSAQVVCLDSNWDTIANQSIDNPVIEVTPDNLAYVIYTSGSTGKPKGTMIIHRGVVNYLSWCTKAYQVKEGNGVPVNSSIGFDATVTAFFSPLLTGKEMILLPEDNEIEALKELLCSQNNLSLVKLTPAHLQILNTLIPPEKASDETRAFIIGGEALPATTVSFWSNNAPETKLINEYGPTETVVGCCVYQVKPEDSLKEVIPIGSPIANTQLYILDKHQQPVPLGVPGELYIGGAGLARGYLNRPELTAAKFIPNPFDNNNSKLYKTGDLARYLSDGNIEYLGRIDNQVKIRGFRIELGEIESALSNHPQVQQTVVICREDTPENKQLVAYIVRNEESLLNTELQSYLVPKLPEYMIPSTFVFLETLPLTPNGKVDRKALPAPDALTNSSEYIPPQNPIQEIIANIFATVLGITKVGIHENFFSLGGHSLLATQVISHIRQYLEVEITFKTLFESPTVAELDKSIEQLSEYSISLHAPVIQPLPRNGGPLPLSWAQERLWFINQIEGESDTYNDSGVLRIKGNLNHDALKSAIVEIVRRHEVLRTRFEAKDGTPVQIVEPDINFQLEVSDWQNLSSDQQETKLQKYARQESAKPFNLTTSHLLRVNLLKFSATESILLVTMHHIISDGWSIGVFVKELSALYTAYSQNQTSPLTELPIQYGDYSFWQRQWLSGEVLENLISYWKQKLAGAPPTLELPFKKEETEIRNGQSKIESFTLSPTIAEKLHALSRQEGATLFMTLLATLQTLLYRYTNSDDIVVGTDIANRNRAETESLIGFFVNLLVLRTNLSGNPTFKELLKRVREVTLEAYAHQDLPFAKLVDVLRPERKANTTPLFQILFVLQNAPVPEFELPNLKISPFVIDTEIARFDLAIFVEETEAGITWNLRYSTDLFDRQDIAKMSSHLQTLLTNIANNQEIKIKDLEMLTESEKEAEKAAKVKRTKANFKKFKSIKPKAVSLPQKDLIKTSYLKPEQTFPLVIQPNSQEVDIVDWAKNNQDFFETNLRQHGAILLKNFNINSASKFEKVAGAITPSLFGEYGDLPREGVSKKVYGSTPYPEDKAILFHNESSHLHRWPQKIFFLCLKAAESGGETPIVDCRKVYQMLNPQLREKLEEKQLMYVRNYIEDLDVSWQDFFHTNNKSEVESYCKNARIEFEWLDKNGLKTAKIRPAITTHPQTGEKIFFNQIQLHHISYLDAAVRQSLLSEFGEERLPRNVYYGDGSPIEDSVIEEIEAIYEQAAISFPWQPGNMIMLDNMLIAHGRNPYVGERKIVVAMGELMEEQ
ncbi:non-ribosomal peptide synthetase [Okeania sp. SIO2G5]|uniref:non-ribosomal peptide synthetase n=1 Tax=Okeania sp. SIO2G5 TaxID=2607796 RepID=UPI0013BFB33A|nr:non-ribosomal peptide synthetase [Okeania sp. SIO2G5]NEP72548.1 amino acid adenylation domain-containing protein [Okeania sp. SIO2G5]